MGVEVSERGGPHDRARIVRRYLSALDGKKPGRSAARTSESLIHRMHQIDTLLLSADPVQRLHLTQERIDLHAEHLRLQAPVQADFDGLEKAFIRVAKAYGDRHDVTYSAWRQIGVDANVLAQAGIHPPAKPNRQGDKTKDDAGSKTTDAVASAPAPAKADKKPTPPAPKKPAAPEAKAAPAPDAKAEKKPAPAKKAATAKKAAPSTNGSAAASAPAKKAAAKKAKEPAEPQSEQQQLPAEAHLLS